MIITGDRMSTAGSRTPEGLPAGVTREQIHPQEADLVHL